MATPTAPGGWGWGRGAPDRESAAAAGRWPARD